MHPTKKIIPSIRVNLVMNNSPPLSFLFLNKLSLPPIIADEAPSALPAWRRTMAISKIAIIIKKVFRSLLKVIENKTFGGIYEKIFTLFSGDF